MKAKLLREQDADASALTPEHPPTTPVTRGKRVVFVFPAGSEFTGEQAVWLCRTGQAVPSDDECSKALKELGISEARLKVLQTTRAMADLGINDPKDQELYRAGVIKGYDEKLNYIPGPNWEAYQKAKADIDKEEI